MNLIEKAGIFADNAHTEARELYDGKPYITHLQQAVSFAYKFIDLIPRGRKEETIAAIYLHDTIEGARISYHEIKEEFGEYVAEIVLALTPMRGRNRKEKQCQGYYINIQETPGAVFAKLCDRLANVEYSVKNKNLHKLDMYGSEYNQIKALLFEGGKVFQVPELAPMIKELTRLLFHCPIH